MRRGRVASRFMASFSAFSFSFRFAACLLVGGACGCELRAAQAQAEAAAGKADAGPPSYAKEIAAAHAGWVDESARIREILGKLQRLASALEDLEKRLERNRVELKKLEAEKEAAVEEMRKGLFCSGCNQTRTQILAKGDTFPHPGQRSVPATPAQVKAVADSFDQRIGALKKARAPMQDEERAKRAEVTNLYHEFMKRKPVYHVHIAREQEWREREWGGAKIAWERAMETLRRSILDIDQAIGAAATEEAKKQLPALEANRRILERQFADKLVQGEAMHARAEQTASSFVQGALKNLELTAEPARPLPNKWGLPGGWFIMQVILKPPAGVACRMEGLRRYSLPGRAGSVRDRLEGEPGKAAGDAGKKKSMKEILEGK